MRVDRVICVWTEYVLVDEMPTRRDLAQRKLEVVLVVQDVHEVCVEGMYILQPRELQRHDGEIRSSASRTHKSW